MRAAIERVVGVVFAHGVRRRRGLKVEPHALDLCQVKGLAHLRDYVPPAQICRCALSQTLDASIPIAPRSVRRVPPQDNLEFFNASKLCQPFLDTDVERTYVEERPSRERR